LCCCDGRKCRYGYLIFLIDSNFGNEGGKCSELPDTNPLITSLRALAQDTPDRKKIRTFAGYFFLARQGVMDR